jgi:hypothetical protein
MLNLIQTEKSARTRHSITLTAREWFAGALDKSDPQISNIQRARLSSSVKSTIKSFASASSALRS